MKKFIVALTEEERNLLTGLTSRGKRLGRPSVPPMVTEQSKALREQGLSYRKIGKHLMVSKGLVRKN